MVGHEAGKVRVQRVKSEQADMNRWQNIHILSRA